MVLVCQSKSRRWRSANTESTFCEFCGKYVAKRKAVGIWGCKDCGKVKAGGAYSLNKCHDCQEHYKKVEGAN